MNFFVRGRNFEIPDVNEEAVKSEPAFGKALEIFADAMVNTFQSSNGPIPDGVYVSDVPHFKAFIQTLQTILESRQYKEPFTDMKVKLDLSDIIVRKDGNIVEVEFDKPAKDEVAMDVDSLVGVVADGEYQESNDIDEILGALHKIADTMTNEVKAAKLRDYESVFKLLQWDITKGDDHFDKMDIGEGRVWRSFINGLFERTPVVAIAKLCLKLLDIHDFEAFKVELKKKYKRLSM